MFVVTTPDQRNKPMSQQADVINNLPPRNCGYTDSQWEAYNLSKKDFPTREDWEKGRCELFKRMSKDFAAYMKSLKDNS